MDSRARVQKELLDTVDLYRSAAMRDAKAGLRTLLAELPAGCGDERAAVMRSLARLCVPDPPASWDVAPLRDMLSTSWPVNDRMAFV